MLPKLQYITQNNLAKSHVKQAIEMYEAGCKWVQLRIKDQPLQHILETANKITPYSKEKKTILTINDYPEIALKTKANGVHIGKNDPSISYTKQLLDTSQIIGATANTLNEVLHAVEHGVDYIGLGPFRFTSTKKKLSPFLGLKGYETIINTLLKKGINTPIYAIGGIKTDDLNALKNTGIYGIAISGMLLNSNKKHEIISEIHRIFAV